MRRPGAAAAVGKAFAVAALALFGLLSFLTARPTAFHLPTRSVAAAAFPRAIVDASPRSLSIARGFPRQLHATQRFPPDAPPRPSAPSTPSPLLPLGAIVGAGIVALSGALGGRVVRHRRDSLPPWRMCATEMHVMEPGQAVAVLRELQIKIACFEEILWSTEGEGQAYVPPDSLIPEYFRPSDHRAFNENLGEKCYYDIVVDDVVYPNAAWYLPAPVDPDLSDLTGWVGFDDEIVNIQQRSPIPGPVFIT